MYRRAWQQISSDTSPILTSLERITILQFNALAQSLCTSDSFPVSPIESLQWEYRKHLLLREIKQHQLYEIDRPCPSVKSAGTGSPPT